jgi:hypothetical protein
MANRSAGGRVSVFLNGLFLGAAVMFCAVKARLVSVEWSPVPFVVFWLFLLAASLLGRFAREEEQAPEPADLPGGPQSL